jgi:catechol 2,3-dioxygenase-like lactoylglutathione lyase family enzyme
MSLDHIGLGVSDYGRAKAFFGAALAPLGIGIIVEFGGDKPGNPAAAGLGRDGTPDFWISGQGATNPPLHVAFTARSRAEVDAFYAAALKAGGRDNGGPGLRPHYHPNYYAAFVFDLDGNNIEAVCHNPA